jgi:hypothetical protein
MDPLHRRLARTAGTAALLLLLATACQGTVVAPPAEIPAAQQAGAADAPAGQVREP